MKAQNLSVVPNVMPRASLLLLCGFFLASVIGCASGPPVSVDYDASEDLTNYETRPISLTDLNARGYGSGGTRLQMRALAVCHGQECAPEEVTIVFQVSGTSDLRTENRSLQLTVEGETYKSTDGQENTARSLQEVEHLSGNIASLNLTFEEFRKLAEAKEVTGEFSSADFQVSHDRRHPLRALIQRVQGGSSKSSVQESISQKDGPSL